jgi:putative lipoprotein
MMSSNSSTIGNECSSPMLAEVAMLKAVLSVALLLAAAPALAAPVQLRGEVTYRERIALPDTAVLSIELVDLALPQRPRLSVSAPTGPGQVPLAFTLTFEDSLILPEHAYALNAEIAAGDLRFRNPEPYPVTPLAQAVPIVIVTNLVAQAPQPSSEPMTGPGDLPLLNITWQATTIGETPVPPGVDVTLQIGSDMRAGGDGGCNSYFSQAAITEQTFSIGEIARTQRSCFYERNTLEQGYFAALKAAASWTVDNDTLTLFDGTGQPTVIFER